MLRLNILRMGRLVAFLGFTLWLGFCLVPVRISKKSERLARGSLLLHQWAKRVLRVFAIQVQRRDARTFEGAESLGRILIANHVSYLDIAVMLAETPCLFLAKKEVNSWPLIGTLAKACGIVFVDRGSLLDRAQVLRRLRVLVNQGHRVVVFPEGTTSLTGPRKGWVSFFPGVFGLARRTGSSVEMRYLDYSNEADCAWIGDASFLGHLWTFAAVPKSIVQVRQSRLEAVYDRHRQTRNYEGARRWYLEGGRSLTYFI